MPKQLKKQLKELRDQLTLETDWKQEQRSLLLTRIKSQISTNPADKENVVVRFFRINAHAFGRQLIASGGIAMAVVLGVFASVTASTSLPGEFFYPMKITSERIQVTLVSDPLQKADLQLNFAKRRVDEIKKVATTSKDFDALKAPLKEYKQAIEDVKVAVAMAKTTNPKQASDLAKTLHAATLNFTQTMKSDVADVANNKEVSDTVKDVIETTKSAELDAVVLIAETGDDAEAKQVITEYLDTLTKDIDAQASVTPEVTPITSDTTSTDQTVVAPVETPKAFSTTKALTADEIKKAQASVDSGDIQGAIDAIKPVTTEPVTTAPAVEPVNTNTNTSPETTTP